MFIPYTQHAEKSSVSYLDYAMGAIKRSRYWKEEAAERAWKPMPDTPEAAADAVRRGAMFISTPALSAPFDAQNPDAEIIRYDDFMLDFDDKLNPANALKDLRILIGHLDDTYNLNPYSISLWCSGGKGFHARLPEGCLGSQAGDVYLPLIYKKMAVQWKVSLELPSVDTGIYCTKRGNMFRIENVKRSNNRYKVPITLDELQSLDFPALWELSKNPREIEPVEEEEEDVSAMCEDLAALYQECRSAVHKEIVAQKNQPPIDPEIIKRLQGQVAPCIVYILTSCPKTAKTNFNTLAMNIVKYFLSTGHDLNNTLHIVESFLQKYPHSTSYTTYSERLKHFKEQWLYHKGHTDSHHNCAYIKGYGFKGSAFDCKKCKAYEPREQTEGKKHSQGEDNHSSCIVEDIDDFELWPELDPCAIHPGLIHDFISAATANSEADPAAVLGTLLTRLSVEVGRNPFMMIGDGRQHVNLLAAIAGPTGSGRKGTSAKPVERLFQLAAQDYIPARTSPGPLSSGEGLIDAVKDQVLNWVVDKKSKTGAGSWVVVHPGVDDKRLFILTEELSSALQAMAREGNTLSSIVRQVFDSGNLEPLTKSSKIKATGAHIGVLGHITIYELNGLLQECQIHNGLINRFLWFCSRRQKVCTFPEPIPDNDILIFQSEIKDIVRFSSKVGEIRHSRASRELWEEFYPGLSDSDGGFMGAVLERAPALVLRLAMLHCLVDCQAALTDKHLETAIMVWDFCEKSARYIFADKDVKNPLAKKIMELLTVQPSSLTGIHKALGNHADGKNIQSTLKSLMERNKVIVDRTRTPGRSKTIYRVVIL